MYQIYILYPYLNTEMAEHEQFETFPLFFKSFRSILKQNNNIFYLMMHLTYFYRGRAFVHGAVGRRIDPSWGGPDWCNKDCGMCYPVCGMVHIKEPLLLMDKSSLCGGSGFPFSLSEWSLTICLTPYNHR